MMIINISGLNAMLADHQNQTVKQVATEDGRVQTVSATGEVCLGDISGRWRRQSIGGGGCWQPVRLRVEVTVHAPLQRLVLGYGIKDRLGQVIYGTNTDLKQQPLLDVKKGDRYLFEITFPANLGPGAYSVQTALASSDTHLINNYEWRDLALVFNVVNINRPHFAGCAWIDPVIGISRI